MKKLIILFVIISIVVVSFIACEKHEPVVNNCPLLDLTTGQMVCACDADKVQFGNKCREIVEGQYYGYNSDCSILLDTIILDFYKIQTTIPPFTQTEISLYVPNGNNTSGAPIYNVDKDTFYTRYYHGNFFKKRFCDVKLYGKFLDNPKRIRLRMNHIDRETGEDLGDCEMLLYPAK